MSRSGFRRVPAGIAAFAGLLSAQAPAKVDFATDVLPLFRQNCVGCHGPSQQQAGLRLDRKSSVMKSFSRRVVPGSSENSFVYHRLTGTEFGAQMPPTGALRAEQIAVVKAWIDQARIGRKGSPTKPTRRPRIRKPWRWWKRSETMTSLRF